MAVTSSTIEDNLYPTAGTYHGRIVRTIRRESNSPSYMLYSQISIAQQGSALFGIITSNYICGVMSRTTRMHVIMYSACHPASRNAALGQASCILVGTRFVINSRVQGLRAYLVFLVAGI